MSNPLSPLSSQDNWMNFEQGMARTDAAHIQYHARLNSGRSRVSTKMLGAWLQDNKTQLQNSLIYTCEGKKYSFLQFSDQSFLFDCEKLLKDAPLDTASDKDKICGVYAIPYYVGLIRKDYDALTDAEDIKELDHTLARISSTYATLQQMIKRCGILDNKDFHFESYFSLQHHDRLFCMWDGLH